MSSWPGSFTATIPFGIDPLVLLLRHDQKNRLPLTVNTLEELLLDTSTMQTNYSLDLWHTIRKKQQKSSPNEGSSITDVLLDQAIRYDNESLLRLFLRLEQFPSRQIQERYEILKENDIRCSITTQLQCFALVEKPALLW